LRNQVRHAQILGDARPFALKALSCSMRRRRCWYFLRSTATTVVPTRRGPPRFKSVEPPRFAKNAHHEIVEDVAIAMSGLNIPAFAAVAFFAFARDGPEFWSNVARPRMWS